MGFLEHRWHEVDQASRTGTSLLGYDQDDHPGAGHLDDDLTPRRGSSRTPSMTKIASGTNG
jgi:hypothetical protein